MIGWSWTLFELPHETRWGELNVEIPLLLAESCPALGMLLQYL